MLVVSAKQKHKENKKNGVFHTNEKLAVYLKDRLVEYASLFNIGKITEIVDLCCGVGNLLKVFDDEVIKYGCDIDSAFIEEANKTIKGIFINDSIFNKPYGEKQFKFIIGNYPFSVRGDGKELSKVLESPIELSNILDSAFIYANLKSLSDDGICLLLGFPGILYRGNKEKLFRKYLVENNYIEAIEEIPSDTAFFDDTKIETVLFVLRKNKANDGITFINKSGEKRTVLKKEIEENDWTLSIHTYIQPEIVEEPIDIIKNTYDIMNCSIHNIVSNVELLELTDMMENSNFADKYINTVHSFCAEYKKDKNQAKEKYKSICI